MSQIQAVGFRKARCSTGGMHLCEIESCFDWKPASPLAYWEITNLFSFVRKMNWTFEIPLFHLKVPGRMSSLTMKMQLLCPQKRQTTKTSKITLMQLSQKNSSHERRVSRCWIELVTVIQVFISFQYQKVPESVFYLLEKKTVASTYQCNKLLCFDISKKKRMSL